MIFPGEEQHTLSGQNLRWAVLRQFRWIAPFMLFLCVVFYLAHLRFEAKQTTSDYLLVLLITMVMGTGAGLVGVGWSLKKYELFISANEIRSHLGNQPEVTISRHEITGIIDMPGDWLVVRSGRSAVRISYFLPAFESLRERALQWCPPDKVAQRNVLVDTLLPAVTVLGGLVAIFATDNPWIVAPVSAGIILLLGGALWTQLRSPNIDGGTKFRLTGPVLIYLLIALLRFVSVLHSSPTR